MKKFRKLSAIYQIRNKCNGKIYIGHSINITMRWYTHMDALLSGKHVNAKLQEDFNTYSISNFEFSILELVNGKEELVKKEQEYLNRLDFKNNYNLYNSAICFKESDIDAFVDYINKKWLVPSDASKDEQEKYRIYKQDDKDEIVDMAIDCQLIDLPKSRITFNRVANFMTETLGYVIEDGRFSDNNKRYYYKLIVDFDDDYSCGKNIHTANSQNVK